MHAARSLDVLERFGQLLRACIEAAIMNLLDDRIAGRLPGQARFRKRHTSTRRVASGQRCTRVLKTVGGELFNGSGFASELLDA